MIDFIVKVFQVILFLIYVSIGPLILIVVFFFLLGLIF